MQPPLHHFNYSQPSRILPLFQQLLRQQCSENWGRANRIAKQGNISPVVICKLRKTDFPGLSVSVMESVLHGMGYEICIREIATSKIVASSLPAEAFLEQLEQGLS